MKNYTLSIFIDKGDALEAFVHISNSERYTTTLTIASGPHDFCMPNITLYFDTPEDCISLIDSITALKAKLQSCTKNAKKGLDK